MSSIKPRVRFAPSPTGFLHVGGLRSALYNYLFAKQQGGTFILRIEDTDQARTVPGGRENIIRTLEVMGLTPFEGPYIQSENLPAYLKHAQELLNKEHAYYCFCTTERLALLREKQQANKISPRYDGACRHLAKEQVQELLNKKTPYVIRLKVPETGAVTFTDLVYGEITVQCEQIDDQVLLKSDGFPTYHLASVVDDHLMEITHVIRGEEWLPSAPKHVLLYQASGWECPKFAHLPLLLNPDHTKLSKRQADVAAEDYLKDGYLPEAILNFIMLLGWHPPGDKEIFSLEEMVKEFSFERVQKAGAVFDLKKLEWMNGLYIRNLSLPELQKRALPFLQAAGLPLDTKTDAQIQGMIKAEQERLKKLSEIGERISFYFKLPDYSAQDLVWKKSTPEETKNRLGELIKFLEKLADKNWTEELLEKSIKEFITSQNWGTGECLWPMRLALSGLEASPGPFTIAAILGKQETLQRLTQAYGVLDRHN